MSKPYGMMLTELLEAKDNLHDAIQVAKHCEYVVIPDRRVEQSPHWDCRIIEGYVADIRKKPYTYKDQV